MRNVKILGGVAGMALLCLGGPAHADEDTPGASGDPCADPCAADMPGADAATQPPPAEPMEDPTAPTIRTGYGATFSIGGGIMQFTDSEMRDFANVGGAWNARLTYGTRANLALEAAYTGGAVSIDALGLEDSAKLLSTGIEVLARINLLDSGQWQPYVAGGIGWRRYSVVSSDTNTSSVADSDDLGEVPLGVGVAYRFKGLVIDARGMFRVAFSDEIVDTGSEEDKATLDNWQGSVNAGWEF